MKLCVRKNVYDEIMKGIVYHTRVSSKGKSYEVPYHTKDDYNEYYNLRIVEDLPKKERKNINETVTEYQNKYYNMYKKIADKKTVSELRKYLARSSKMAKGNRYRNINIILKNNSVETFLNKYAIVIGKNEACYEAIHAALYEKVPGISDEEKDRVKGSIIADGIGWEDKNLSDEECKEILSKQYKTPIGNVHYGENQLSKFDIRKRNELIWAADKILSNPSVIAETREGPVFFVKDFVKESKDKIIISVMISGTKAIISTHPESMNTILYKIKKDGILYEKDSIS